jgi:hypothetical protein
MIRLKAGLPENGTMELKMKKRMKVQLWGGCGRDAMHRVSTISTTQSGDCAEQVGGIPEKPYE